MNEKKKVAIIGGGAAGLTTAWLLDKYYDITLFEKNKYLGGHAHTVTIPVQNEIVTVDTAFEFFSEYMFPNFNKLLHILNIQTNKFRLSYSFYRTDPTSLSELARAGTHDTLCLPPFFNGKIHWQTLTPANILKLLEFIYFIYKGKKVVNNHDLDITLKEFADSIGLSDDFQNNFLFPLLVSGWGATISDFKKFSAFDILYWSTKNKFSGFKLSPWSEIVGGVKTYIDALNNQLSNSTQIKLSTKIIDIKIQENKYLVIKENNDHELFDYLVLATPPNETEKVIKNLPQLEKFKAKLKEIEYFHTKIAIHSDVSLMPKNKADWRIANVRFNGIYSSMTFYKLWKSNIPIFKSWITYDDKLPNNLYAIENFVHRKVTPKFMHLKEEIKRIQGNNNLWFAGFYTCGVDSHDSAILSALNIAKKLTPESERLKLFY